MVLVDRRVGFVDELDEVIRELGGVPLDEALASALRAIPWCSSDGERGALQCEAIEQVMEEEAFDILLLRKATTHPPAVRKEPFPPEVDAFVYRHLLCGIDLRLAHPVAGAPSVTRLSVNISWPPGHRRNGYPSTAFISSSHHCFLALYVGRDRPGVHVSGFYLVYNAWANSVAIVPPLFHVLETSHCDIGSGVVLLCCGNEGDYLLAELLLRRDARSTLPTNKATLFTWDSSSSGRWVEREVVLPLPDAPPPAADHEQQAHSTTFCADMAFAVSFSSICWVDLLKGILVYNHIHSGQFHFIPLPEECVMYTGIGVTRQGSVQGDEFRSMCCIDRQTLKLVSMDTYSQERPSAELMIRTWTLRRPLSPTNCKWEKDVVLSNFRIRDLWDDPVYKDVLKLPPLMPTRPVISAREPDIIYVLVDVYEFDASHELLDSGCVYVLTLNLRSCRVESAYKVPCDENGITLCPRLFTSDFSSYLNKTREWDMKHGIRDYLFEVPRGTELADEGASRSNPSTPYRIEVDLGMLKLSRSGGLGARRVIPTPSPALRPSSRKTSSSCPVGLQAALDIATG